MIRMGRSGVGVGRKAGARACLWVEWEKREAKWRGRRNG